MKVGGAAAAEALDSEPEELLVLAEHGDVHQGVDLGEIDVTVPGAHPFEGRAEGRREHPLHALPVGRLPVGMIAEELGGWPEQRTDPPGDEEILPLGRHVAGERPPPDVEDRDPAPGSRLVTGGRPDQRVGIRLPGVLLLVGLACRRRVKPPRNGQAVELAEGTRPRLLPRGEVCLHDVEFGLADDAPRMNEGVGLSRRGRRRDLDPQSRKDNGERDEHEGNRGSPEPEGNGRAGHRGRIHGRLPGGPQDKLHPCSCGGPRHVGPPPDGNRSFHSPGPLR